MRGAVIRGDEGTGVKEIRGKVKGNRGPMPMQGEGTDIRRRGVSNKGMRGQV